MPPTDSSSLTAAHVPTPSVGPTGFNRSAHTDEGVRTADEVRDLLCRRLLLLSAISSVLLTLPFFVVISGGLLGHLRPGRPMLMILAATIVMVAGFAQWLYRRPGLSTFTLRIVEACELAGAAVVMSSLRIEMVGNGLSLRDDSYYFPWVGAMNGFGWLSAIVSFGVIVPNTWRAAAVRVFALAACPLAIDLTRAVVDPAEAPRLVAVTGFTLPMLAFGIAVTLFGSAKLAELQARVREAERAAAAAKAVGPYELQGRLGGGGMGDVYLAEHRLLKRPCAVKVIRADWANDPSAVARFDREVRATARLRHPNTVEVYDYGRADDGTFYYVMEHLDGMSLDVVLSNFGKLPAGRVVYLLRQVCGALAEAHAAGLVHRDVKPANVMVCRVPGAADVAKLLDFGLARVAAGPEASMTMAGVVVGTPHYMAPEQSDGRTVDARADLYSLGATAYHLLAGRPPFERPTAVDVVVAHRYDPVPTFADLGVEVAADLETVVRRCLAKKPEERYGSAEELRAALGGCAAAGEWSDAAASKWWAAPGK